jgi:hypothetical protein
MRKRKRKKKALLKIEICCVTVSFVIKAASRKASLRVLSNARSGIEKKNRVHYREMMSLFAKWYTAGSSDDPSWLFCCKR